MTTPASPNRKRRVVANISLSLDGRVNGVGGDYDMSWIVPHAITDGAREHMVAVTAPATTAVLGRKNYEGFAGYWPSVADDETADDRDRRFSHWLNEVEKVVVTTTLDEATWPNTTLTTQSPADVVADLRSQEGGDIIVLASRSVIRDLLNAGEIDQLSVTLCPETVGGGARLFDEVVRPATWALVDHTVTESGALCLRYDRIR